MRCPRCRSEVGSQKLCPYCGSSMYLPDAKTNSDLDYASSNRVVRHIKNLEYYSHSIEKKLKILIVLQGGILAVLFLIMIAILFR